ncbi:sulfurtransferase complex subunit TusC [Entomomonas asaccharolytica]|uniref:Sulfurtransferase complex subunit TusC n=1 Tax=Entomomonas asaccharolytica TaxID=2785331 RepID=A0A974NEK2_9GAMM|nr:sulfurtransferase complex subunit TusC [Entomomonas asaccharolytica]QQP85103.1 sulfurtransferase complex subunit TusC [Entomomonas asaccharolytica]
MAKSMLIICKQAPWGNISVREILDLALAGGAFDLPISLLFLEDGVFQLVANQQAKTIQQKDISANLQALPLFGIEELLVAEDSLAQRGLTTEQLILPVKLIPQQQLTDLLTQYDVVVTN